MDDNFDRAAIAVIIVFGALILGGLAHTALGERVGALSFADGAGCVGKPGEGSVDERGDKRGADEREGQRERSPTEELKAGGRVDPVLFDGDPIVVFIDLE